MTLREILADRSFEDVHLVHDAVDNEPVTIVELNSGTLTETGRKAWADVLDAKILSVFQGIYGLQIQLEGVKERRLDAFSRMLAGYCSASDYDNWVAQEHEALPNAQIFYLPVSWESCGYVGVKAASLEAAVEHFKNHADKIGTPANPTYVDGSFALSCDEIEELRIMHEAELKRRNL